MKKDKYIPLRLDPVQLSHLEAMAVEYRITRTAAIRLLIDRDIEQKASIQHLIGKDTQS